MFRIFILLFLLLADVTAFAAKDGTHLKTFNKWEVFIKTTDEGRTKCIIMSQPAHSTGFSGFRETPRLNFSSTDNGQFTVSTYLGFILHRRIPTQIFINNKTTNLVPYREFFAHTYSSDDDLKLLKGISSDKHEIRVRSVNKDEETANDYYQVTGLDKAFAFLKQNYDCR